MANTTLFGSLGSRIVPVQKLFGILKELVTLVDPDIVFNAANPVPVNLTVVDFMVTNQPVAGQVGGTATLESDLNGAGVVPVSDAMLIAAARALTRAVTIDAAQSILTAGQAVEDILQINKHLNTDIGTAVILAYLT